jgi:hypothetical protein
VFIIKDKATRKELKNQPYKLIYGGNPMVSGLKPTWQNMKGGGGAKTPVEEIVGQCYDWRLEANRWGSNDVTLMFNQCQILKSDTPFPYAEWELAIKYSDNANSGWGIFGNSAATALGIDIELLDIDLLKTRWIHLLRSEEIFGDDAKAAPLPDGTQPKIKGFVWRIIEFVQPGQPVAAVAQMAPAPIPMVAAPVAVATPVVNGPAPAVAVATPPVVVAPVVAAPVAGLSPDQQALELLHGRDISSFFQVAVPDVIIRTDAALVNSILSNAFVTTKIASGDVVRNDDGTHTVVAKV